MNQEWKDDVLAELAKRGHNKAWLAEKLGVRRGMVTKLFARNPDGTMRITASALVPQICAVLDMRPPTRATQRVPDGKGTLAKELVESAPPELQDLMISVLERLLGER